MGNADDYALPLPSMVLGERMMGRIHRLLQQKGFNSTEEANAYLHTLMGQPLDDEGEEWDDPIEQAQQLAYDAMEADTAQQARKLAKAALELDSDCVDAIAVLAQLNTSPERRLARLRDAVDAGERRLGKEYFAANKGHFWGLLETRPYMRARQELALELLLVGRPDEAAKHYEAMLELCPNDNLGVRYELIGMYLWTDQMEAALSVIERYRDEDSAFFHWASVLVYFSLRRFEQAERALKAARAANPYVEKWLIDEEAEPRELPAYRGIGDQNEADFCAFYQGVAWIMHPLARFWLRTAGRPGDGKYLGGFLPASR